MGKSPFLNIFKFYWIIRYNHIPLKFLGLTSINFGNKLNCCSFNGHKKNNDNKTKSEKTITLHVLLITHINLLLCVPAQAHVIPCVSGNSVYRPAKN